MVHIRKHARLFKGTRAMGTWEEIRRHLGHSTILRKERREEAIRKRKGEREKGKKA